MMPHQTDRLSYKSPPIVRSTLILHYAVALLLLTHSNEGQSQVIGQSQSIVALVGNYITLPCHVKPATDTVNEMLEWSRPDLNPRFVHVRRSGDDRLVDQNPSYKERTSVSIDGLKQGDASLTLSKVKLSDEGTYICFIPRLNTESSVQLVVDDFFTDPSDSGSTAYIIIGLVVGVLVILAVALAAWKWRQNKIKTKKQQEDEETQRGGEKNSTSNDSEQEGLLERETDSEQSKKERQIINNQNTMEDKNNLAHLGEGTKLSYQTEEETYQEKTEGETSNILIQGQEESESTTVEIAAPGPAEVETQKEQAGRTESVNTETATLMDGHRQQQQVRAAADTNNETEKEEKEEDIKSTKDEASSQGPTDDKRQHTDPTAGGGVMNDSDQTGGQTGRSDDPPVPAERKQQQVRAAGESSNDTNTVEKKDLTQTTEKEAAAQGPTDDKTQPSDPTSGGETKTTEEKDNNTYSTNNQAAGPTEGETQQNDRPAVGGTNNTLDQTGGLTGKRLTGEDTPCPTEKQVKNGDRRDGGENTSLLSSVKQICSIT